MNSEITGIICMFVATILLAIPLGNYMGKIYSGHKTWPDKLLNPLDKFLAAKLLGIGLTTLYRKIEEYQL